MRNCRGFVIDLKAYRSSSSPLMVRLCLNVSKLNQKAEALGIPKIAMRSHRRHPSAARNAAAKSTIAEAKKMMATPTRRRSLLTWRRAPADPAACHGA
jgi:hypothetical protein